MFKRLRERIRGRIMASELEQLREEYERFGAEQARKEQTMNTFFKGMAAALIGGVAAAGAEAVRSGGLSFEPEALWHLGGTALAGGLIAAAAYLKQSPLPKKDAGSK